VVGFQFAQVARRFVVALSSPVIDRRLPHPPTIRATLLRSAALGLVFQAALLLVMVSASPVARADVFPGICAQAGTGGSNSCVFSATIGQWGCGETSVVSYGGSMEECFVNYLKTKPLLDVGLGELFKAVPGPDGGNCSVPIWYPGYGASCWYLYQGVSTGVYPPWGANLVQGALDASCSSGQLSASGTNRSDYPPVCYSPISFKTNGGPNPGPGPSSGPSSDPSSDPSSNPSGPCVTCGNPINVGTGNKYQRETDYAASGNAMPLKIERHYNGYGSFPAIKIGANWRLGYDRTINVNGVGTGWMSAYRGDGRIYPFHQTANGFVTDGDVTDTLTKITDGTGATINWKYYSGQTEETELYNAAGKLISITNRLGLTQTLIYSDATTPTNIAPTAGLLIQVTDAFGHQLNLAYDTLSRVSAITDPDSRVYQYAYDASTGDLISVTYPDTSVKQYLYNEPAYTSGGNIPHALTGIFDENKVRLATFTYDPTSLRAISTEHAGGVEKYVVSGAGGSINVLLPTGATRNYFMNYVLGVPKPAVVFQPCSPTGCSGTVRSDSSFDANGNRTSYTDFNRFTSNSTFDLTRNLRLTLTEAVGRAEQRKISTSWNATWRRERAIAGPFMISTFNFNGDPGVSCAPAGSSTALICSKSIQSTTDANGLQGFGATLTADPSRTWSYTYNAVGQVLAVDGPRTDVADVTSYSYDAQGNVATITNARGQVTSIPQYDASGRPLKMVDPNGLETLLSYYPRGWLQTRSVGNAANGYLTTSYIYDAVGQLQTVTLPDGSFLSYKYDDAHRLTRISDTLGNRIVYTLDNMGNRVVEQNFDTEGTLARSHTRQIDILNRLFKDIGATNPATQVTTQVYDDNGNLMTITDPLSRLTTQKYDALNRLVSVTDPFNGAGHLTKYDYDAEDRLTKVTDPKGLVTSYTYNGFGEMLTQVSPDTGTATFTYDAAGNLKTKNDARNVGTLYSYDELNRVTAIAYPDESVNYIYDTCANGIGRLCTLTDKTGTTSYSYDLWGRVTAKSQTVGTLTQTVGYAYDSAGQLAQITTPSGKIVSYGYQNNRPVTVSVDGKLVLDQGMYEPFGPIGGWRWGDSTLQRPNFHVRFYDQDYRAKNFVSDQVGPGNLTRNYAWFDSGTIASITDPANTSNTYAYNYDSLDRLTTVTGGATLGFSYDGVGNRLTQTVGAATTNYSYPAASSRLSALTGATAKNYTYDAVGNTVSDGTNSFIYAASNRMSQVTRGSSQVNFLVNALGQRVKKFSSGASTRFVYDEGGRLIGEYDETGKAITETVWLNDLPVAVIK
jgi:YD repeat-containing protein